ncbi:MAG: DUF362 domain-containing protein [Endomicrobium sp.]|nr:DUF362 domain-containing protein [Endomicrobium sp.]
MNKNRIKKSFLKVLVSGGEALSYSLPALKNKVRNNSKELVPRKKKPNVKTRALAAVTGNSAANITRRCINLLGGMSKFVKEGDIVVIKPNMSRNAAPGSGLNTNPDIVGELVKMCFESGAKTVKVFDNTRENKKLCYKNSGIMKAAKDAGAKVLYVENKKCVPAKMSAKASIEGWPVFKEAVECDVFINVPAAKISDIGSISLSIKNLMGVCGGDRTKMHWELDKKLAELCDFIKPDLNVIDAFDAVCANVKKNTVIACADPVLADAYAAKEIFNIDASAVAHIARCAGAGIGNINIKTAKIKHGRSPLFS